MPLYDNQHPLQRYLNSIKRETANGEYGNELKRITAALGISLPTLRRLAYRPENQRRTLSPAKAIQLEIMTDGKVPCGSVNDHIDEIMTMIPMLEKHRANRLSLN
jgi:hypothetical protein